DLKVAMNEDAKDAYYINLSPKAWGSSGTLDLDNAEGFDENIYQESADTTPQGLFSFTIKPDEVKVNDVKVDTIFNVLTPQGNKDTVNITFAESHNSLKGTTSIDAGIITYNLGAFPETSDTNGTFFIDIDLDKVLTEAGLLGYTVGHCISFSSTGGFAEAISTVSASLDINEDELLDSERIGIYNPNSSTIAMEGNAEGALINRFFTWRDQYPGQNGNVGNTYGDSMLHKPYMQYTFKPGQGTADLYVKVMDKNGESYNLSYTYTSSGIKVNGRNAASSTTMIRSYDNANNIVAVTIKTDLAADLINSGYSAAGFDHVKYVSIDSTDSTFNSIKFSDAKDIWSGNDVVSLGMSRYNWVMNPNRSDYQDYSISDVSENGKNWYQVKSIALSDFVIKSDLTSLPKNDPIGYYSENIDGRNMISFDLKDVEADYLLSGSTPFSFTAMVTANDPNDQMMQYALFFDYNKDLKYTSDVVIVTKDVSDNSVKVSIDLEKALLAKKGSGFEFLRINSLELRGGNYKISDIDLWDNAAGDSSYTRLENIYDGEAYWDYNFLDSRGKYVPDSSVLSFNSGSRVSGGAAKLNDGSVYSYNSSSGIPLAITSRNIVRFNVISNAGNVMESDGRPLALDENFTMLIDVVGTDNKAYTLKVTLDDTEASSRYVAVERDLSDMLKDLLPADSNTMISQITGYRFEGVQFSIKELEFVSNDRVLSFTTKKKAGGNPVADICSINVEAQFAESADSERYTIIFRSGGINGTVLSPDGNNQIVCYLGNQKVDEKTHDFGLKWILTEALGKDSVFSLVPSDDDMKSYSGGSVEIGANGTEWDLFYTKDPYKTPDQAFPLNKIAIEYSTEHMISDWANTLWYSPAGTSFGSSGFDNYLRQSEVLNPYKVSNVSRSKSVYDDTGMIISYNEISTDPSAKQLKIDTSMSNIAYDVEGRMVSYDKAQNSSAITDYESIISRDDGTTMLNLKGDSDDPSQLITAYYADEVQLLESDKRHLYFDIDSIDANGNLLEISALEKFSVKITINSKDGQEFPSSCPLGVYILEWIQPELVLLIKDGVFDVDIHQALKDKIPPINLDAYTYKISDPRFSVKGDNEIFVKNLSFRRMFANDVDETNVTFRNEQWKAIDGSLEDVTYSQLRVVQPVFAQEKVLSSADFLESKGKNFIKATVMIGN
ncbi:MAG: hypothetical protein HQL29_00005, partial [Candidatus Omnitrophica bacterium]|nr:hypothetical protein [Candidatus Omnitrophota bacterium]